MGYSIPIEQDINITSGDDANFQATIKNSDGVTDLDMSLYDVFFTVKRNKMEFSSDTNAIYQVTTSSVTISAAGSPLETTLNIPYFARESLASDATPMRPGTYYYDVQLVSPSGVVQTWWKGRFNVKWHSTVRVTP